MFKPELTAYFSIAKSIESLLYPYAEIVIHDLEQQKIVAIFNNFSKRKIGEDSLLEEEINLKVFPDFFEPYYKINWDGRRLKSTTATIRNSREEAIGLLCINLDISKLEQLEQMLTLFTHQGKGAPLPQELFQDDWREKINLYVHNHLKKMGITLKALSKADKKELVGKLYDEGAFKAKHAAAYVGEVLDISRATVYKYLTAINFEKD